MLISILLEQTIFAMKTVYPSTKSQHNYTGGFRRVERFYQAHGQSHYNETLSQACVKEHRKLYERGCISESTYKCVRKAASLLEMYAQSGEVVWKKELPWGMKSLQPCYEQILSEYLNESINNRTLSRKTIKTYINFMRKILFCYEERGICTVAGFSRKNINEVLTSLTPSFPRSMVSAIDAFRSFLRYAEKTKRIDAGLSSSLPPRVSLHQPIRPGFSEEELNQMLEAVDLSKPYGKRDYAILFLAIQTGLRGVDIINLQFSNIDWDLLEVRIVQHKTRKPLILPMSIEVGNAIADYILHNRPESDSQYVFLRSIHPFCKLADQTATDIAQRYMNLANIDTTTIALRGFHSIRRSFGARMLDAEISIQLISEMLGHADPDSTKPYIAVHDEGLRHCALSLAGLEVREGVLR